MRISLVDPDRGKKSKRRDRKRPSGRRRPRTFESATTLPQLERRHAPSRGRRERFRPAADAAPADEAARPGVTIPWRKLLARLPAFLLLAGLIGLIVYGSAADEFFVYEAEIRGANHLQAKAIYQAGGVHEQNIFWIQPDKVAGRISALDGIREARVHLRILPAQVVIEVKEREPAVMWRTLTQAYDWWLDGEGVVLPYHGDIQSPDTIFVVDSSERYLQVGDQIEPQGLVRSVQQLAAAMPAIRIFFYDVERGLSYTQETERGQWPVYVGTSDGLERKIQVVQALDQYLAERSIRPRYVDVRVVTHPVYGKPQ